MTYDEFVARKPQMGKNRRRFIMKKSIKFGLLSAVGSAIMALPVMAIIITHNPPMY